MEIATLIEKFQSNAWPAMLAELANNLGVGVESLQQLGIGYAPVVKFRELNCDGWWTIPERDEKGRVVGIGLRNQSGEKVMFPGSKHGLIYECVDDYVEERYRPGAENWVRTAVAGVDCPVCNKPDGCLLSADNPDDPKAVICRAVKLGAVKQTGLGFLHIRKESGNLNTHKSPLAGNDKELVVVVEGMSDVAAWMGLGFPAVGRPSNLAGLDQLRKLLMGRTVVVVGENDKKPNGLWPGKEGMEAAAKALTSVCPDVRMVMPPPGIKDSRAWIVGQSLTKDGFLAYLKDNEKIPPQDDSPNARGKASELLISGLANAEFFHDGERAYIELEIDNEIPDDGDSSRPLTRREVFAVESKAFRRYLGKQFYSETSKIAGAQAIDDAVSAVVGECLYSGSSNHVYTRIAGSMDEVSVDLCDGTGRVVGITQDGWVLGDSGRGGRKFVTRSGMEPLPVPTTGGDLEDFRKLVNIQERSTWVLLLGWIVGCFHPTGPYPVLSISGGHGSGKSTLCEMVRQLVDPTDTPLRSPPDNERDLMIAGSNSHILSFDNVSKFSPDMSDALCRISTGGGFATRELYSNDEERRFNEVKPVLLNGIGDILSREDLRNRAIILPLNPIGQERRLSESEIWAKFDEIRPGILGCILDAVAVALHNKNRPAPKNLPRMADFAQWVLATDETLGFTPDEFVYAMKENREESNEVALEGSSVGEALLMLMKAKGSYEGTMTELLSELNHPNYRLVQGSLDWPKMSRTLAGAIDRISPLLHEKGILIERFKAHRGRLIRLRKRTDLFY